MDRTLAEILFQIGRGRTIWAIVIFVHLLLFWLWRKERSIAWLSVIRLDAQFTKRLEQELFTH